MTVAITLMEAYLIETPLAAGMSKESLLKHLQQGEAETLNKFVGQLDYHELIEGFHEREAVITEAIQSGYTIKFVSIAGIERLLELKFNIYGGKDFEVHENMVIGIPFNNAQLTDFEKMLSPNWKVYTTEREEGTYKVNVVHNTAEQKQQDIMIYITTIKPEMTYQLRHSILRPHQSLNDCKYDTDQRNGTFHIGAFHKGTLICTASFNVENNENFHTQKQYRLRAMATLEAYRNLGVGRKVIAHAEDILNQKDVELLWCNGRTTVQSYYEKLGFKKHGEVFDYPPIGPHIVMYKKLK